VHHSDRALQYASSEYVNVLRQHQMIPSMSRPANPYDNASCESFMKTLKREEIYANCYKDLGHMRVNIEEFIERYYNRQASLSIGLSFPGRVRTASRPLWVGGEHRECKPCVFQTMTKTDGKFSWRGATSPPLHDPPASHRDREGNQKSAGVPKKTLSLKGCSRKTWEQLRNKH
jgi:hypothetical protein